MQKGRREGGVGKRGFDSLLRGIRCWGWIDGPSFGVNDAVVGVVIPVDGAADDARVPGCFKVIEESVSQGGLGFG